MADQRALKEEAVAASLESALESVDEGVHEFIVEAIVDIIEDGTVWKPKTLKTAILDVLDEYDCSDYEPEIVSSLAREVCANMDNAGNRGGLEDAGGDSDTSKDKDKKKKKKKNKKAKREEARRQREAEMQAALGGGAAVVSSANSKRNLEEMGDDVIFRNFTIHMRGLMLFENASITLAKGFRYGLVGYNGAGKTTLLRQIARGEGEFALPPHIDILHVEQEIEPSEKSAIDTVMESDVVRMRLMAEAEELENLDVPTEQSEDRLAEVYELLEDVGAARAEARASAILSGLQFTEEMKLQPTREFSGGWRMRISLARALFLQPRLLLLDEPTNHLDLHAAIWLENYLQKYKHTILVVSHDREFLNGVITHVVHLWEKKLDVYPGTYDKFVGGFERKLEEHAKAYEKQQKRLAQLRRSGKVTHNVGKKGKGRESKGVRAQRNVVMKAEGKKKKKGKRGGDDDEDEVETLLEPIKERKVRIWFEHPGELPLPLLQIKGVTFGYSDDKILFRGVDFGVTMESRVALVGANGTGKSTLLKLMTQELTPMAGSVEQNRKLRLGVFNQHFVDQLNLDMTPVEYIQHKFDDCSYENARRYLGSFGLPSMNHEQVIRTLSGGQKSRVMLVELCMSKPHILLLDEPTNNLDMETNDALADAINEFEGGVIFITHSMHLISACATEILVLDEHDQSVDVFDGDFEDYRDMLIEDMEEEEAARTTSTA